MSDFSLLDPLIYKVSGRGMLYMCVVHSLAAYAAHFLSRERTHPPISVIYTMCTLEALDILPLKTSLRSVSNLIFSQLHVSARCEFLETYNKPVKFPRTKIDGSLVNFRRRLSNQHGRLRRMLIMDILRNKWGFG